MLERSMTLVDPCFVSLPTPAAPTLGLLGVTADPVISDAVRGALSEANITVLPVHLPTFEHAFAAGLTILAAENWKAFGHLVDSDALGADVRTRLLAAREVTPDALQAAERCRVTFRAEVDAILDRVDALALPTLPDFPLSLEAASDARAALRMSALVRPFNLSGHPALTLPLESTAGLPIGLQLVGRHGADAALCALARRVVKQESPCT
jgi:amidase